MATSIKYTAARRGDGVLLGLREGYEQAVLDFYEADREAKAVRPALEAVGHTSNFLNNMRLPVHRWFRYSAGFSAEWVKWLLSEREGQELRVLDPLSSTRRATASGLSMLPSLRAAAYAVEVSPGEGQALRSLRHGA